MEKQLKYRVRRLFSNRPNPTFRHRPWTKIINWGNRHHIQVAEGGPQFIVNKFEAVMVAGNKLATFEALKGHDDVNIPNFTTDRAIAAEWLSGKRGSIVVCRTTLHGHSGAGIVLATIPEEIVPAPLYVEYIKKQKEFRVHVAFGEVIDVQEKRQRKDLDEGVKPNFQVRNHSTGWVYCREDLEEPVGLRDMAIRTVALLKLDFGAVDLLWNAKRNVCCVLEVNTAPGLEGSTVEKYADAFVRNLK